MIGPERERMQATFHSALERVTAVGADVLAEGIRLFQVVGERLLQVIIEHRVEIPAALRSIVAPDPSFAAEPDSALDFRCVPVSPDACDCRPGPVDEEPAPAVSGTVDSPAAAAESPRSKATARTARTKAERRPKKTRTARTAEPTDPNVPACAARSSGKPPADRKRRRSAAEPVPAAPAVRPRRSRPPESS